MLLNLHTHLEGRVRPSTAAELAAQVGLPCPAGTWKDALQLPAPSNLTTYLEKVSSTYPLFADRDFLTRIAREAVEDSAADGQDYLELRFGPATHIRDGLDIDEVITAICEGVDQGVRETGTTAGVVVAALRLHGPEENENVARAAARHAGRGVVGFDLAGDELIYPDLRMYAEAFSIARAAGLGLTCHAAEAGPANAALDAIDLLGVTRIGHGAHIADDFHVLREVAERGVIVEICPSSNWYTGAISTLADHPALRFHNAGVPLVLGDDNPRQTGSPLSNEHMILEHSLGFSPEALSTLERTSVEAAFMDESTRTALRRQFL